MEIEIKKPVFKLHEVRESRYLKYRYNLKEISWRLKDHDHEIIEFHKLLMRKGKIKKVIRWFIPDLLDVPFCCTGKRKNPIVEFRE